MRFRSCGSPEHIVVDLFDPPVHIANLKRVVNLRDGKIKAGQKHPLNVLASEFGIGRMTVRRALEYKALLEAAATMDLYRVVDHPHNFPTYRSTIMLV